VGRLKTDPHTHPDTVIRLQWPCEARDIFAWLHNQKTPQKLYWASREDDVEIGGLGVSDRFTGNAGPALKGDLAGLGGRLLHCADGVRYFGGFSFDRRPHQAPWTDYPRLHFTVPRFEITREGRQYHFAVNLKAGQIAHDEIPEILAALNGIDFKKTTSYREVPRVKSRRDAPDKTAWFRAVEDSLKMVEAGTLLKVVLARQSTFDFDRAIDPVALLAHLKPMTSNSFHYCFQYTPYHGFIGATPERLLKWEGRHFHTEALAGSTPRGADDPGDRQLARKLFDSRKNSREHELVVEYIRDVLLPRCQELNYDTSFSLLKLKKTQHLISRFRGDRDSKIPWEDLISALHPTPAVGGVPTADALKHIAECEPFSRGWYTGGVGWIGKNQGELAVGIRGGLVDKEKLYLYAGAGIVPGSSPQEEWDEIENKIAGFIKVFYQ
jgi:menaquinone-specific isochorismate synthase